MICSVEGLQASYHVTVEPVAPVWVGRDPRLAPLAGVQWDHGQLLKGGFGMGQFLQIPNGSFSCDDVNESPQPHCCDC